MVSTDSDRNKASTDCEKLRATNREEQDKILATFDLSGATTVHASKLSCLKSLNPEYRHLITSIQADAYFAIDAKFLIDKGKVEEVLGDHSPAKCLLGLERLHVRNLYWANARQRDKLRYLFDMEGLIITDNARNGLPR
ncbi:unnamed protein product [Alternaria sp. RS040]